MRDIDIVAAVMSVLRFEADAVIVGIEEAVGQPYVFAVDEIDAIVVPDGIAFHLDAVDEHVPAAFVFLDPVERILYGDPADGDAVAMIEQDDHGTIFFCRPDLAPGIWNSPFSVMDLPGF